MNDSTPNHIPSTNIEPPKSIQSGEKQPSNKPSESFGSLMKEGQQTGQATENPGGVTPFDLVSQKTVANKTGPSMDTLLGQMTSTSSVLGDIQSQLQTKNLNLKQSQKYLLSSKLSNANQDIRSAAEKVGVKMGDPTFTSARRSPITKFLGLITDGQDQLNKTQEMIQNMKTSGGSLNPSELLTIQVKLAKAQQELEYSSVLLSKAVDDIKTMFNIQL